MIANSIEVTVLFNLMAGDVSLRKWFFMNDLTRRGGRPWEFGHLGAIKQSAAEMVCRSKCYQNHWVGRMIGAWKGGRAVRRGRAVRL